MKNCGKLLKFCVVAAMLVLPSCSWCWPSLHTAETLCHQERGVVVVNTEDCDKQYVWQGKTWLQVKLACAIDKGRHAMITQLPCTGHVTDQSLIR